MNTPKQKDRWVRRLVIRFAAGCVILLALGGPTPGYVGSCSLDQPGTVDVEQFCVDRRSAECVRDRVAMRIDQVAYEACSLRVPTDCASASWTGCEPSPELAEACIAALRSTERLATPNDQIVECSEDTFCGSAPLTLDDGI